MCKKIRIFFTILFFTVGLNNTLSASTHELAQFNQQLTFEVADPTLAEFLVSFAIASNDIYQTPIVKREIAEEVFALKNSLFEEGVVEVLKRGSEIVDFYTLMESSPSDTSSLQYELKHFFIKAGLQKQGLGTLLFKRALSNAQLKGWSKLEWLSDPDATEFYIKMGAEIIDYCENLLNPTVDLPIFRYNI